MFEGTKWVKAAHDCSVAHSYEHDNKLLGATIGGKFLALGLCFSRRPMRHGVGEFVCAVVDSDWQLRLHVQL